MTNGQLARGNLAVPDRQTAAGALKILALNGEAVQVPEGDVCYRSLSGEFYPATVVHFHGNGFVDLDVHSPGVHDPVRLTRIRFKHAEGQNPTAA